MAISWNGTREFGQHIGDTLSSIKVAWIWAQHYQCDKYLLAMSPRHDMNPFWKKFIDTFNVQVIYDNFDPGNADIRFATWDKWRKEREIDGIKFDVYKELYRRIDGGNRQGRLCGGERGLGRKNIFEYFYYGQEEAKEPLHDSTHFGSELFYGPVSKPDRSVLVSPHAKCQGNGVFTFDFWSSVVHGLIDEGITVTVNYGGAFCEELNGNPLYRKIFPDVVTLQSEVAKHKLVTCGNTGVGWLAAATGIPLLAMQHPESHIQDYRYEWCGVKSLVGYVEHPDPNEVIDRIMEQLDKVTVLTTGCYDLIHPGHIRHLEESRSYGTRLVVCLNSDASVRQLKGQGRPIHNQDDRAAVLRGMKSVDEVRIFDGENALPLIEEIRPAIITNGPDHVEAEVVGKAFIEQYGGKVIITGGERSDSTTKILARKPRTRTLDLGRIIRDGIGLSVNPYEKLKLLAEQFLSVSTLEGEVAEIGTCRGGCGLILRRLAPDKHLHLFENWGKGNPHSDPLCHHVKGEWKAELSQAKTAIGESEKTHYHSGVFPATAAELDENRFCFVYVDCDTYQSTKDAIEWFWPRIVPGGKMLVDDWGWEPCRGVQKAVEEAFKTGYIVYGSEHGCLIPKPKEGH